MIRPRRALIALPLLVLVACKRSKPRPDDELNRTLAGMRAAIESYRREQGRYPSALDELVPKYLQGIPADPVTGSPATWHLSTEETVQPNTDFGALPASAPKPAIIDVHSGAGHPYASY